MQRMWSLLVYERVSCVNENKSSNISNSLQYTKQRALLNLNQIMAQYNNSCTLGHVSTILETHTYLPVLLDCEHNQLTFRSSSTALSHYPDLSASCSYTRNRYIHRDQSEHK